MSFRPSLEWTVAPTGQTTSHGAFSHCMHGTGWKNVTGIVAVALIVGIDAEPVHVAAICVCSLPTTAILFSAWQAIMQLLQPTHEFRSIAMPHAYGWLL